MDTHYTLRPATVDDVETIVSHRRRMFEEMGGAYGERPEVASQAFRPWLIERLQNGRYLAWLMLDSELKPVASIGLWLLDWPPGPLDLSPYRGYIYTVYTQPEHRRQGLARRLLQACLDECQTRGIPIVLLHASDAGRPLYLEMGFQQTNEMRLILKQR
ncbi:MAG TPA: GNAT family N-acetyltransferase [Aggregatilineales bacterium]|nr:GNAT family N-acetyltransferase [Aggregatilineales bacterium]